jgi:aminopeptidase N
MNKIVFTVGLSAIIITIGILTTARAQQVSFVNPDINIYRETPTKINDLVHTKLDVRFDFKKRYMFGREWVTLKPHFYPTDTLRLDAKGMNINNISVVKNGKKNLLKYTYDSLSLSIKLDKIYQNTEAYTIYIDYTAKPNELKNVRNDGRGLYFINPDGTEKDKPTQIWTQGETEYNSAWFPTIDKPNQKTTSEISITVPAKYVTLSNGSLIKQKNNADGTRTDIWKMNLPHSPYLFMMAVGDFKVYKDSWKGREISYYLEPQYAPFAKDIFGTTPEAIEFFSHTLGIDFPWSKYSQIRVRDYVSGAMENTTATVFGEDGKSSRRELADRNYESGTIHELFHQWFGDYVTAESWSNLTLNESFANFGETIWAEYKYGRDVADEHLFLGMQMYLDNQDAWTKNLVRFHYEHEQDLFDAVTYQKGASILGMLRNYMGNDAFYKGLHIYLKNNAFKNAEVQQLRLAMEEASGIDLNWFFNQWFYGAGHPMINISYKWDDAAKTQTVYIQQTQDGNAFILPMAIDIYVNGEVERHKIWMRNRADTFSFHVVSKPDLVNIDADKILLAKKADNKTLNEYAFQYANAPLFLDRYEAIDASIEKQAENTAQKILIAALNDKYYGLRSKAINALDMDSMAIRNAAKPILISLAQNDKNNLVRADAINALGKLKDSNNANLFKQALKSDSYAIQGASLNAFALLKPNEALTLAKKIEIVSKGKLTEAIINVYATYGHNEQWDYVYHQYTDDNSPNKYSFTLTLADFTGRVENPQYAQEGIEAIKNLITKLKRFGISKRIIEILNQIRAQRILLNDKDSVAAVDKAINEIQAAQ